MYSTIIITAALAWYSYFFPFLIFTITIIIIIIIIIIFIIISCVHRVVRQMIGWFNIVL